MWHASDVRHSCCMNEVNSHKPAIAGEGEVIIVTFLVLPSMYLDCSKVGELHVIYLVRLKWGYPCNEGIFESTCSILALSNSDVSDGRSLMFGVKGNCAELLQGIIEPSCGIQRLMLSALTSKARVVLSGMCCLPPNNPPPENC